MQRFHGIYFETTCASSNPGRTGLCQVAGCAALLLAYFFLLLPPQFMPDIYRPTAADWKAKLIEGEAAWHAKDLYSARALYSQTARIASWSDDWIGILSAACGLKRLEIKSNSYFATRTVLVRAMIAADKQQSRAGLMAAARAFDSIREHKVAAMIRDRNARAIQNRAQENPPARLSPNC